MIFWSFAKLAFNLCSDLVPFGSVLALLLRHFRSFVRRYDKLYWRSRFGPHKRIRADARTNLKTLPRARKRESVSAIARAKTHLFNLQPDIGRRPAVHFEFVDGSKVIADVTRTLEIRRFGPTSHVRRFLCACLPDTKAVLEGDLFSPAVQRYKTFTRKLHIADKYSLAGS